MLLLQESVHIFHGWSRG